MSERKASRELDAEIAVAVFGYEWVGNPRGIQTLKPKGGGKEVATRRGRTVDYFGSDDNPYLPRYSTDIAAAWQVFEKLCQSELTCSTGDPNDGGSQMSYVKSHPTKAAGSIYPVVERFGCQFWSADGTMIGFAEADTAPLAICLAALAASETT